MQDSPQVAEFSGGRKGQRWEAGPRESECDPWARACGRVLPRQRFGLCGARALLGVTGTGLINFNGPHVPGMVSSKLLTVGEGEPAAVRDCCRTSMVAQRVQGQDVGNVCSPRREADGPEAYACGTAWSATAERPPPFLA